MVKGTRAGKRQFFARVTCGTKQLSETTPETRASISAGMTCRGTYMSGGMVLDTGDVLDLMHGRSRMTLDPRIPTTPGRSMSGFHGHGPGRHCLLASGAKCREVSGESHEAGAEGGGHTRAACLLPDKNNNRRLQQTAFFSFLSWDSCYRPQQWLLMSKIGATDHLRAAFCVQRPASSGAGGAMLPAPAPYNRLPTVPLGH